MSRFRDFRPHEPLKPKPSRKGTAAARHGHASGGHGGAKAKQQQRPPDLGPRPVSARQQAHRDSLYGGLADVAEPVGRPFRPGRADDAPARAGRKGTAGAPTRKRVRGSGAAAKNRRRLENRKRVNLPRVLLVWASAALAVELALALIFSPRLWVKRVVVEGNGDIPAQSIIARLGLGKRDNILRLKPQKLEAAVLGEPRLATAAVYRRLPDTLRVVVAERAPWAAVQIADGACWIVDKALVPFRTADVPPVGLPLVRLASVSRGPKLGAPLTAPGLDSVAACLAWAGHRPDFVLDAVSIDSKGKLCLNRAGGTKILLGSGRDLDKKLRALDLLLAQRAELRDPGRVAYVNLYAYDAPAISLRSASRAGDPAAGAAAHSAATPAAAVTDGPTVRDAEAAADTTRTAGSTAVPAAPPAP